MKRLLDSVIAWLRNLRHRPALLTILANNSSTLSSTLTSLVSIPLALHYLNAKEFGLWAFTGQSIGYFLLLDLGVSSAVSRLLAEPLAHGNRPAANQWFTLCAVVLTTQGAIIGLSGWLLVDHILVWFAIPPELMSQARTLWLWMFALAVAQYLIRIMGGILYAQNRFYWNNFGNTIAFWVGLAAFVGFLKHGDGILSYAYSSAVQTACAAWVPWLGVRVGPDRLRFDFSNISFRRVGRLYGFSGALSLVQIANLLLVSGQTLIVTKWLGLEAAAGYNVSAKIIMTARGVLWQLFESFLPGWQQLFLRGQMKQLFHQWQKRFDLVMSVAFAITSLFIALNPWFVRIWARPQLYQGFYFDLAAAAFCLATMIMAGFAFPQTFAMRMWLRSVLQLLAAGLSIWLGILWIPSAGTASVLWAGATAYVSTIIWYNILQFHVLLKRPAGAAFEWTHWKCLRSLIFFAASVVIIGLFHHYSKVAQAVASAAVVVGSIWLFIWDWQGDFISLLRGRGPQNKTTSSKLALASATKPQH
jgi:O-antigen/teichoic acid export membrane protein